MVLCDMTQLRELSRAEEAYVATVAGREVFTLEEARELLAFVEEASAGTSGDRVQPHSSGRGGHGQDDGREVRVRSGRRPATRLGPGRLAVLVRRPSAASGAER